MEGNGHRTGLHLIYRTLALEEWPQAGKLLDEHGFYVPNAQLATAHVAETLEGEIVGLGVLQMMLHAEPWVVKEGWHGKVDLPRIERLMAARGRLLANVNGKVVLPGYILNAADERSAELAKIVGFEHVPTAGGFWRKDFR